MTNDEAEKISPMHTRHSAAASRGLNNPNDCKTPVNSLPIALTAGI
jgi:hypothetical protein